MLPDHEPIDPQKSLEICFTQIQHLMREVKDRDDIIAGQETMNEVNKQRYKVSQDRLARMTHKAEELMGDLLDARLEKARLTALPTIRILLRRIWA